MRAFADRTSTLKTAPGADTRASRPRTADGGERQAPVNVSYEHRPFAPEGPAVPGANRTGPVVQRVLKRKMIGGTKHYYSTHDRETLFTNKREATQHHRTLEEYRSLTEAVHSRQHAPDAPLDAEILGRLQRIKPASGSFFKMTPFNSWVPKTDKTRKSKAVLAAHQRLSEAIKRERDASAPGDDRHNAAFLRSRGFRSPHAEDVYKSASQGDAKSKGYSHQLRKHMEENAAFNLRGIETEFDGSHRMDSELVTGYSDDEGPDFIPRSREFRRSTWRDHKRGYHNEMRDEQDVSLDDKLIGSAHTYARGVQAQGGTPPTMEYRFSTKQEENDTDPYYRQTGNLAQSVGGDRLKPKFRNAIQPGQFAGGLIVNGEQLVRVPPKGRRAPAPQDYNYETSSESESGEEDFDSRKRARSPSPLQAEDVASKDEIESQDAYQGPVTTTSVTGGMNMEDVVDEREAPQESEKDAPQNGQKRTKMEAESSLDEREVDEPDVEEDEETHQAPVLSRPPEPASVSVRRPVVNAPKLSGAQMKAKAKIEKKKKKEKQVRDLKRQQGAMSAFLSGNK